MKCGRCGNEVPEEDLYFVQGQYLCEDCAMARQARPQACDVWAVRIATNTRRSLGQTGAEGLTELQRRIYEFIIKSGGASPGVVAEALGVSEEEVRRQFSVLRHCELARAEKRGDEICLVPWVKA